MEELVVVEDLTPSLGWWVKMRCWLGRQAYYLRVPLRTTQKAWFTDLRQSNRLKQLSLVRPLHLELNPAADLAFASIDSIEKEVLPGSSWAMRLMQLYGNPDILIALKKNLTAELVDVFYCQLLIERVQESLPESQSILLVPGRRGIARRWKHWRSLLQRKGYLTGTKVTIRFPLWITCADWLSDCGGRARTGLIYVYTALMLVKHFLKPRHRDNYESSVRFAIAVISPLREFASKTRGVGFLLNGKDIQKDNTVFIPAAPITRQQKQKLTRAGLRVAVLPVTCSVDTILLYLIHFPAVVGMLLREPEWVSQTYVGLLRTYVLWKNFPQHYPVSDFISYCDFGFRHIGRNILLRASGVHTWFYVDTVNGPDNFPKPEDGMPYRQHIYGFLMYDTFVSWCERHARWNRMLHQKVGRYVNVGSLWSESIRLIKEGVMPSRFSSQLAEAGGRPGMKIVSAFDSWFHDAGIITLSDVTSFIRDLERLLMDFEDVFLVIKEKRPRWFLEGPYFPKEESRIVYGTYEALAQHRRCFLPGYDADASEIVAVSDLVIAFPFTSVGIEALGARCKVVFHDARGKFRQSALAAIPGLVSHSYEELHTFVSRLLYETSQQDYDTYLDTFVKGESEPYLDGMALTRFRHLLAENVSLERTARSNHSS